MTCGICSGPLVSLGVLSNLEHFRCRNCGAQSSAPVVEFEDEDELDIVECTECGARFDIVEQLCPRCRAINCAAYKPSHNGKDQQACKSGCVHREACPW